MIGIPGAEPRRSPAQAIAAAIVILVALSAVGGLVAYRFLGSRPHHASGAVIGSVRVVPGFTLRCTLPVTAYGRTAAMISLPDGAVRVDSSAPSAAGLKGGGTLSFDAKLQKWLPVERQWVSPDGHTYAYTTMTSGIPGEPPAADLRIHDVSSGRDKVLWKGQGNAGMIGWSGTTIYFSLLAIGGATPPYSAEVWAVDSTGGRLRRVGPNPPPVIKPGEPLIGFGGPGAIGGGATWSVSVTRPPGVPIAGSLMKTGGPDSVTRMDLGTGAVTTWFTAPEGQVLALVGLDGEGRPIIATFAPPAIPAGPPGPGSSPPAAPVPSYFLVTGRGQAAPLAGPTGAFGPSSISSDDHGTWFTTPGQLWLLAGGKLSRVADVPASLFPPPTPPPGVIPPEKAAAAQAQAAAGAYLVIAGPCA